MPLQRKRSWMNWDGLDPIAAWQPVGAPSVHDALWNWRNQVASTADAYPTWSPRTGWSLDGLSQSLSSLIVPASQAYSYLISFANAGGGTYQYIMGKSETGSAVGFGVTEASGNASYYNGGSVSAAPAITAGVMGIAGAVAYRNGVAESGSMAAWSGASTLPLYIGRLNGVGFGNAPAVDIYAVAIYDTILTPAQMWLRWQMLAYLDNPTWSAWTPPRRWFFIPPPAPVAPAIGISVFGATYLNSADTGGTALWSSVTNTAMVEVSGDSARTGTWSFKMDAATSDANTGKMQATVTAGTTKYIRFGLYVKTAADTDSTIVRFREGTNEHVNLLLLTDKTLRVCRESTTLQSGSTILTDATWYCIEVKVTVHDVTGAYEVRIDGVREIYAANVNTRGSSGTGTIDNVVFCGPIDSAEDTSLYYDDIAIRSDTWCGQGGVYVAVPASAGTNASWTPSAGSAYECVNETDQTFTDYIATDAAVDDVQHDFAIGAIADADYRTINLVAIYAYAALDAAGTASASTYGISNGSTSADEKLNVTGSAVALYNILTTDPNGAAAWTRAAVLGLKAGVKTLT